MEKRFTLIEIVVTIVVLAILLSIVGIKISDFKNSAVNAAVNTNVSILQTSVDTYKLKNNSYPVKNKISLTSPQLIDIEELVDGGYLKKDLDLKKIKSQYYWVDVFGRVWGSTENVLEKYTVVDTDITKTLNFDLPKKVVGYNIYEVSGYNEKEIANLDVEIFKKSKSNIASAASSSTSKYIRLVKSVTSSDGSVISYEVPNKAKTYLVSTIDQYGLESAPVGEKGNSNFTPLIDFEGTTEFEITGQQVMEWVRFYSIGDTPGDSKIEFEFKVKDKNGNYKAYQKDFETLESSTGITVKIIMTGDSAGNKPSLYDMRVIYTIDGDNVIEKIVPDLPFVAHPDYPNDIPSNLGKLIDDRILTEQRPKEDSEGGDSNEEDPAKEEDVVVGEKAQKICPVGYRYTNIDSEGNILDDSNRAYISYLISLKDGKKLSSIEKPVLSDNLKILNTKISYSKDGRYQDVRTISEVPSGSCVNIYFTIEKIKDGKVGVIAPPVISIVEEDKKPEPEKPKKPNNIETPFIDEEPAIGEEWTTVSTLRFVGSSSSGQPTKWIGFEAVDTQPENTRIVYEFSALVNNTWTPVKKNVLNLESSAYALVIAKLQVKTEHLGKEGQKTPTVTKVTLISEEGTYEIPHYKPVVIIIPSKDNNEGRNLYSTKSKITWDIFTYDQYGKEIVDVEWENKQETYDKAGNYVVKARVKNSDGIWSNWASYHFPVVDEEPVARLKNHLAYIRVGEKVDWQKVMFDNSYDPDGDKIVERQWDGNIKEVYNESDIGVISLRLRVKDSEGYWSPWVEDTAVVYKDLLFTNVNPDTYDDNLQTSELIETRRNISWLEDLTSNRVVMTYQTQGSSNVAGGHFLVFDKEGKPMTFRDAKTNEMVDQLDYKGSSRNETIEFIVPEGAEYIQLVAYTQFSLTEISAGTDRILPTELKNISTVPSPFSVTINWDKEADVEKVLIYRDGKYVGSSTTDSFVDTPLTSLTMYTYTLESVNANGHRTGTDTFTEKTTRPVVLFKSDNGADLDRDPKTVATYLTTEHLITWNVLDGYGVPADLEDKVVRLNASFNTGSATYGLSVIDKDGNELPTTYFTTNNYNENFINGAKLSSNTSLYNFDYSLLMPKGAFAIRLYSKRPKLAPQEIYVKDVYDLDATSKSNDLKNVQGESTPTSIKLTWEADNTVKQVFIYRNGKFIATVAGSIREYIDTPLSVGTEYEYSFKMYDQHRNVTTMNQTFKFETLGRDLVFYDNLNTTDTSAWYDEEQFTTSKGTSSVATIPKEGMLIKWKIKDGSGIKTLNGKEIRTDLMPESKAGPLILTFIDEKGNELPFEYKSSYLNSRFTIVNSVELGNMFSQRPIRGFIIPEKAVAIKLVPKDANTTVSTGTSLFVATNAYENPDKIQDVQVEETENSITLNWTKRSSVNEVEIYRDGQFIGTSTTNTYSDKVLPNNKEYTYLLVERSKVNNRIYDNTVIVAKTKLPEVYFTSNVDEYTLSKWIDKSYTNYTQTSQKVVDFHWNVKEGASISKEDLVGKSITLTTANSGTNVTFLNDKGEPLTFWYSNGINRYTQTTAFLTDSSANTYYIQIPEGAEKLRFSHPENSNVQISLRNLQFADYKSDFSFEFKDVVPNTTSIRLNFNKENVKTVYIFANDVYNGISTSNTYSDNGLLPETDRSYYFMAVDAAHNMKLFNYDNPIAVKSLAKEWKLVSDDFSSSELNALIDSNTSNIVAKVDGTATLSWVLREDVEGYKDSRYNRLIITSAVSNSTTKYKMEFLDEYDNPIRFINYNTNRDSLNYYAYEDSYIMDKTVRTSYSSFFPEGASKIKLTRIEGTGTLNLSKLDNPYYKTMFDPSAVNLTHEATTGSIQFNANRNTYNSARIYINGDILNMTNTVEYDKIAQGEKISYNYLLFGNGSNAVYYHKEMIDVDIPEDDIIFYSKEGMKLGKFFSSSVDRGPSTMIKEVNIGWKVKEGVNISPDFSNRILELNTTIDRQFVVEAIDSVGNIIPTLYYSGSTNDYVFSENMAFSSTLTRLVIPEGANSIRIRNINGVEKSIQLNTIKLVDAIEEIKHIPTVNQTVNKTNISFNYNLVNNQNLIISLEGEMGDIQTVNLNNRTNSAIMENLFMNKEYRVRISLIEGGKYILLKDTVVKTLSNDVVLTTNQPVELASVMLSDSRTSARIQNSNVEVNWEDVNGSSINLEGKTIRYRGNVNSHLYPYFVYFKDESGNNLEFSYVEGANAIVTGNVINLTNSGVRDFRLTVPKGAVKMVLVPQINHTSSVLVVENLSVTD